MAEVTSGRDLTVIILQQEEAEALMDLLYLTQRDPAGIDKGMLNRLASIYNGLNE